MRRAADSVSQRSVLQILHRHNRAVGELSAEVIAVCFFSVFVFVQLAAADQRAGMRMRAGNEHTFGRKTGLFSDLLAVDKHLVLIDHQIVQSDQDRAAVAAANGQSTGFQRVKDTCCKAVNKISGNLDPKRRRHIDPRKTGLKVCHCYLSLSRSIKRCRSRWLRQREQICCCLNYFFRCAL